jgi:tyrosyl-tRNA synthetase
MARLSDILKERGYAYQFSSETLEELTDREKRTVYLGIDPSADSLHVGNLQAMLVLRRFLEDGHKVILLIGGGTGMIGDPSGKSEERNLLDDATIEKNARAIERQARQLFAGLDFELVNNASWLRKLNYIEFLRDIGKHFSVNAMLQRDSVKDRLQNQEQGISYTEFSYMLLQAYDFLHLFEERHCEVQIGASDQWGNILSGVDLIRRKTGKTAYALTSPLLINKSTGKKFGKSEQGAIWLDGSKTPLQAFYDFWLSVDDGDVEEYLMKMSLVSSGEIQHLMAEHRKNPAARQAQRRLASAVTEIVHGKEKAMFVEQFSKASRTIDLTDTDSVRALIDAARRSPETRYVRAGTALLDLLVLLSLSESKSEARRLIKQKGVRLNGSVVEDEQHVLSGEDLAYGIAIVQKGSDVRLVLRKGRLASLFS